MAEQAAGPRTSAAKSSAPSGDALADSTAPDSALANAAKSSALRSPTRRAGFAAALIAGLLGATGLWQWARRARAAGEPAVELHARPRRQVELRFSDAQGKMTNIAAFRGRIVLLNIWATWCAPCREELPTLDALQAQLGGPQFAVVALSIDAQGLAVAQPFLARIGVTRLQPYADTTGEAAARYSATGVPLVLVLDRQGREIGRRLGRATWDNPATVELMRALIARPDSA